MTTAQMCLMLGAVSSGVLFRVLIDALPAKYFPSSQYERCECRGFSSFFTDECKRAGHSR